MNKINEDNLKKITGGTSLTGSLLNAITSLIDFVYDIGKNVGSSFRRISGETMCRVER